jgi:hypothetical protein
MKRLAAVALSSMLLASGCSGIDDVFGKECTEIGCLTFARIELVLPADVTSDQVQVLVERDGKSALCDFGAVDDPCHKGFQPDFDPAPSLDTADKSARPVVLFNEAPKQVKITVSTATRSETIMLEPDYSHSQPNGPECGPGCSSASTRAVFSL